MDSFTTSRFACIPSDGSKQNREAPAGTPPPTTPMPANANGKRQRGGGRDASFSPAAHAPSSPLSELNSSDFSSPMVPSPQPKLASPDIRGSQPPPTKVSSPSPKGNAPHTIEAVPIRRNPKRVTPTLVAKRPAVEIKYPEDILGAALAPMTQGELEEWEGWIELESEPAFFNIILRDLGVQNVKIQEVFALDEAFIQMLPKPVYGLIFCYQYVDDFWDVDEESDTDDVWFANQTVDNACATVAMMNIVMNTPSIPLEDTLQAFKDTTTPMTSSLRGHTLSKNKFIRTVHNGFTRRLDHLNADLWLSNDSEKTIKRAKTIKRGGKAPPKGKKKKKRSDAGFHFIAYVPVNGYVWELDGLKSRPKKMGPIKASTTDAPTDWTLYALPYIEARMAQYDEEFQFNLLALCQSPLAGLRRRILEGIRALEMITLRTSGNPEWEGKTGPHTVPWDPLDGAEKLAEFGLHPGMIPTSRLSEPLKSSVASVLEFPAGVTDPETHTMADLPPPSAGALAAMAQLWAEVVGDVKEAATQYSVEMGSLAEDEVNVQGRKRDHTPAIHTWVRKLAEKGILEQLAG